MEAREALREREGVEEDAWVRENTPADAIIAGEVILNGESWLICRDNIEAASESDPAHLCLRLEVGEETELLHPHARCGPLADDGVKTE